MKTLLTVLLSAVLLGLATSVWADDGDSGGIEKVYLKPSPGISVPKDIAPAPAKYITSTKPTTPPYSKTTVK